MSSDSLKKSCRPLINTIKTTTSISPLEKFQNTCLRPIIKLQHELLLEITKDYFTNKKNIFYQLSIEQREEYLKKAILRDVTFKKQLQSTIIALMTVEEYRSFCLHKSELNKRIIQIIKERLLDHIHYFYLNSD